MSGTEHTPGPWTVTDVYYSWSGEPLRQIEAETVMIAEVYADCDEGMKNARLIAAAPELLEACRATITYLETRSDVDSNKLWGQVSAAVREAIIHERD
jgi:hypothetical protein